MKARSEFELYIKNNLHELDKIYPHTEMKIKYVREYVKRWLYTACNYTETKKINFIDCMCNAGIYQENILGTPTEILIIFKDFAEKHKNIEFNLFLNDCNEKRIEIMKEVII